MCCCDLTTLKGVIKTCPPNIERTSSITTTMILTSFLRLNLTFEKSSRVEPIIFYYQTFIFSLSKACDGPMADGYEEMPN